MAVAIRTARPDDAAGIIEVMLAVTEELTPYVVTGPGEFAYTVEQEQAFIRGFDEADNSLFLVAEAGGAIIGVLVASGGTRSAERHLVRLGISVHADHRNKGVGRALIQHCIEWARTSGIISRIELFVTCCNERAIHLYRSCGFEIEGRRIHAMYKFGQYHDDYLMALLLDARGSRE